jgi:hypothetical protein
MASGAETVDRAYPGTTQMRTWWRTLGAADVQFTVDELKQFNTELSLIEIKGERLPKMVLDFSDVEHHLRNKG